MKKHNFTFTDTAEAMYRTQPIAKFVTEKQVMRKFAELFTIQPK